MGRHDKKPFRGIKKGDDLTRHGVNFPNEKKQKNKKEQKHSIEWIPQKRQLDFLKACGLGHPFPVYLDEKTDNTPVVKKRKDEYKKHITKPDARVIVYGGAAGGGKGQPASGLVVTPYGLRKMEDISVGDRICSPTHGNTQVIHKIDLGITEIYEVEFADKTSLEVTSDHIWKVSEVRRGKNKKGLRYRLMTTEQIIDYIDKGYYDLQIPLTEPVQFTKSYRYDRRNIDPYVLGCLLGDGCITKRAKFSTKDREIADIIENKTGNLLDHKEEVSYAISNDDDIIQNLDKLGLLGTKSNNKFIPEQYLYWSIDKRFELAQGLMDTDGSVDDRGHVSFTSVSEQLAKDTASLIRSLGYRVTMSEKQLSTCNGERKQDKYRLYIQGKDKHKLFKLDRKRKRCKDARHEIHKKIINVKLKRREQAYCIKVSNPNGLYIAGEDYIVTHNSDAMLMALFVGILSNPGAKCGFFRRKYTMLEGPGGAVSRSRELFTDFPGASYNKNDKEWTFSSLNNSVIKFAHLKEEDSVYDYQSQQFDYIAFDEATQFIRFQYRYMLSRNRATVRGLWPIMIMATNPGNVGHVWFKNEFVDIGPAGKPHDVLVESDPPRHEKHLFIPAYLSDNIVLEDRDPTYRKNLENQSEIERERLLRGNWDIHAGQFFPAFDRDIHVVKPFDIPDYWKRFISIDYGLDCSAVYWYALDDSGFYYAYKELWKPNLSLSDLALAIRKKTTPIERDALAYTVVPPDLFNKRRQETGKSGRQILVENGLSGYGLRMADNRRVEGWRVAREYLKPIPDPNFEGDEENAPKTSRLLFFDTCRKMISHLPQLQHDDNDPDDAADEPHEVTHSPESLRYFVMSRPPLKSETDKARKERQEAFQRKTKPVSKYTGY